MHTPNSPQNQPLPACLDNFRTYFEGLSDSQVSLSEIYRSDIDFQDPIHHIQSLEALQTYFQKLNANLVSGGFKFSSFEISGQMAFAEWEMQVQLKKPNKQVRASGVSVLRFEDKIYSHRDYFDAGELFYEQVPILGGFIRFLKRKIAG